jgi:hypothetical protein
MRPDIALIILAIIVASIFSLHLLMGFIECMTIVKEREGTHE